MSYATATVGCTWGSSSVPRTATYSLFEDNEAMQKSVLTRVRDSGYGPSCRSAEDFTGGGKVTVAGHELAAIANGVAVGPCHVVVRPERVGAPAFDGPGDPLRRPRS